MRKKFCFLSIFFISMFPFITKANEQSPYKAIAFIPGKCTKLILAGSETDCSFTKVAIYYVLKNGKVLLVFPLDQHRMAAFVAGSDSQPSSENYYMYLSKIDIDSKATHSESKLGGECSISMSTDGKFWHSANCQAQDADGSSYVFQFSGDSKPVNVIHP